MCRCTAPPTASTVRNVPGGRGTLLMSLTIRVAPLSEGLRKSRRAQGGCQGCAAPSLKSATSAAGCAKHGPAICSDNTACNEEKPWSQYPPSFNS